MAGFSTNSNDHLIRSDLWSSQIKEVLEDELMGLKYVDMITDFPDGDTINIPSLGQAEVYDYAEGQAIRYTAMDTGNFTFTITDYKASATYITNKMKQDSFYMSRLMSSFVPKQNRAIMKSMEVDLFATAKAGQTSADTNTINGAYHRYVGGGTSETITVEDFAKAKYALQKANVPMTNLVAIVDPSVEYQLSTLTNLVNFSNNPRWEGIVSSGISTGMKFIVNVYGFDVYVSQNLQVNTASETISSVTAAAGVNNLFFSAAGDVLPFVGNVRQSPVVDSEYNKDLQRDEYVTTCRYGFKLFRPENMVIVVTDTDQVYA
jgi:HK97 family phage major capsid protein